MNKDTVRATRSDGERSRRTILHAAARLATLEGLDGLSIGRLAEHIGMSKSGLYAHFGSKEELQLATIETAASLFDADVVRPTESIDEPLERVAALVDRFLDYLARRVFPGGCFFAAAAAEFDTHPGPVKDRLRVLNREWLQLLEALFARAQDAGSIKPQEKPSQLAFEVDGHLLMANMVFVLHDDESALERALLAVKHRIDAARTTAEIA
jgi:AcrR family transcriptional regulator